MKSPHLWSVLGISKRRLLPAIPIAILLTVGFAVVFSARRALNHATQAQAREGQMAFTLRSLDASTNLARSLGSETVAATPSYTSGVFLLGDLFLGRYAPGSALEKRQKPELRHTKSCPGTSRIAPAGPRPQAGLVAASRGASDLGYAGQQGLDLGIPRMNELRISQQ